jgi:hypothetical protein
MWLFIGGTADGYTTKKASPAAITLRTLHSFHSLVGHPASCKNHGRGPIYAS